MIAYLVAALMTPSPQLPELLGGETSKPIEKPPKEWKRFPVGGGLTLALPAAPKEQKRTLSQTEISSASLFKVSLPILVLTFDFREWKEGIAFNPVSLLNSAIATMKKDPTTSEFNSNIEEINLKNGKAWHLSASFVRNQRQYSYDNFLLQNGQKTWQIQGQYRSGDRSADKTFRQVVGSIQVK